MLLVSLLNSRGVVDTGGKFASNVTAIKVNIGKDVTTGIANIEGAPRNKSNGAKL
jgi:hypothetical protein